MDKEAYEKAVLALESIKGRKNFYDVNLGEICGADWEAVRDYLVKMKVLLRVYAEGYTIQSGRIDTVIELTQRELKRIRTTEERASVAHRTNVSQIRYNRHAVIVSYISLGIAILATTPLPKMLYRAVWRAWCGWFGIDHD